MNMLYLLSGKNSEVMIRAAVIIKSIAKMMDLMLFTFFTSEEASIFYFKKIGFFPRIYFCKIFCDCYLL